MRVAILGGGGFRVPLICRELARVDLRPDELVLYDVDPDRLRVIEAVLADGGLACRTTTELAEAVAGADVVFMALRVGGLDGRVADERTALDLGLLGQETVGPGGLRYATRTVPVVDEIARTIARLAPGAWTITLTNPAGIVTEAMADELGPRVIGVCDSPVALVRRACAAAGIDPGGSLAEVTAGVEVDYLGLNHLGWLRALRHDGVDVLPGLLADATAVESFEEGRLFGADLVRALGAIPNEYLYWYYAEHEALRDVVAAGRTRGEHVRTEQRRFYAEALAAPERAGALWRAANEERDRSYFAELREGEREHADVAAGGYESVAVALAIALTGGPDARLILNVPNAGTVTELPADAVLETVCRVDADGVRPLPAAPPTLHQLGVMASVKSCERDIITAARSGNREAALRAYALHPLVRSLAAARRLVGQTGQIADVSRPGQYG